MNRKSLSKFRKYFYFAQHMQIEATYILVDGGDSMWTPLGLGPLKSGPELVLFYTRFPDVITMAGRSSLQEMEIANYSIRVGIILNLKLTEKFNSDVLIYIEVIIKTY